MIKQKTKNSAPKPAKPQATERTRAKQLASPYDDNGPVTEEQVKILRQWVPQEPFEVDCGSL